MSKNCNVLTASYNLLVGGGAPDELSVTAEGRWGFVDLERRWAHDGRRKPSERSPPPERSSKRPHIVHVGLLFFDVHSPLS